MNDFKKMPLIVQHELAKTNSAVLLIQQSDLTSQRMFGNSYLVLTNDTLMSIDSERLICSLPLDTIQNVTFEELVGGGRVLVKADNKTNVFTYCTNHFVPHFIESVRVIQQYSATKIFNAPAIQKSTHCDKCNNPLPERDGFCPQCVPHLKIMKRILSLVIPYKMNVILLIIFSALGVGFQVVPPYITKKIVDDVIGMGRTDKIPLYIGMMITTGVFYLLMRLASLYLNSWISARIVTDLRSKVHNALQYLKFSYFSKREPGEFVGRIMYDTGELLQFLVEGMPFLLINVIMFFAVGIILLKINWILTLLIFIPVPALLIGSGWFWRRLHPLFLKQGTIVAHLHSQLNESLQGLRVVKACAKEEHRIRAFDSVNLSFAKTQIHAQRMFGSFNEVMFWLMSLGISLVWFFAVRMITQKNPSLTLGDLLAFVGYIWLFYGPLQWFAVIINWMTQAFSGAERIFEVIDASTEKVTDNKKITLNQVMGEVEFKNVHFSYEQGKEIIKGVSFKIAPGEMIGLVGQSGAGKSTIINLLTRFNDPDAGEILLDGEKIQDINLMQIREACGIVLQEPFLFSASIAENIAYGADHYSMSQVIDAAKAAQAHEFIMSKSDGYDTLVGDGGERLSGGEKQRIAIARAIFNNPPILILDEATSSVDTTTERHIQDAINQLVKGRTTIAIAHRLSTLKNADRLIVLSEGRIAEMGTHDELLKGNGIYSNMVKAHSEKEHLQSVIWG
jgi:ATP-binding cassette subfamily B protein